MTESGDKIGTIERVSGNKAMVKPTGDLSRSIRQRLGWDKEGADEYELAHSHVAKFSGDEVHLKD